MMEWGRAALAADSEEEILWRCSPVLSPILMRSWLRSLTAKQESEALVVKGLLDSAGIENDLASASLSQDAFPGLGGMIILVREEDAREGARA